MVVETGEKIFVITRRLLPQEVRRHFVGKVTAATELVIRVVGFAYVYDDVLNDWVKREELRTRIFTLTDAELIINILPRETLLDEISYTINQKNERIITDGKYFKLNINEFSARM